MDWEHAAHQYQQGATLKALAAQAGVSYQTARRRLEALGVPQRGKRKTQQQRQAQAETMTVPLDLDLLRRLADGTRSCEEIAAHFPVSAETIRERMQQLGLPRLPAKARPHRNQFWAGGFHVDRDGYILRHMPDHPDATAAGYVREHRLVMERHLGRRLLPQEVVDHRNRDTSDNRIENLQLYPSNAAHLSATLTGRKNLPAAEREVLRREAVQRAHLRVAAILAESGSGADRSP